MKHEMIRPDDVYYPLISTPFGKVPLVGATMTDEREREIAEKYPVLREHDYVEVLKKEYPPVRVIPASTVRTENGRHSD